MKYTSPSPEIEPMVETLFNIGTSKRICFVEDLMPPGITLSPSGREKMMHVIGTINGIREGGNLLRGMKMACDLCHALRELAPVDVVFNITDTEKVTVQNSQVTLLDDVCRHSFIFRRYMAISPECWYAAVERHNHMVSAVLAELGAGEVSKYYRTTESRTMVIHYGNMYQGGLIYSGPASDEGGLLTDQRRWWSVHT
jgi:hypothetical protein